MDSRGCGTGKPGAQSNRRSATNAASNGRSLVPTNGATASADGTARIWDATTGAAASPPLEHPAGVAGFSNDGRRLLTACDSAGSGGHGSAFAQVWEVPSGQAIGPRLLHQSTLLDAHFSPDGSRIVTASADQTACLWDAATGERLTAPLRHSGMTYQALFSPAGRRVVTGSEDGAVRVWDAATDEPVTLPMTYKSMHDIMHLRFSPDGEELLIATGSDEAWLRRLAIDTISQALSWKMFVRSLGGGIIRSGLFGGGAQVFAACS